MSGHLITIGSGGAVRFIHDDELLEALEGIGPATITRASTVEPAARGGWEADLGVSGGPVLTSKTRRGALEAEVAWLRENLFGGESE